MRWFLYQTVAMTTTWALTLLTSCRRLRNTETLKNYNHFLSATFFNYPPPYMYTLIIPQTSTIPFPPTHMYTLIIPKPSTTPLNTHVHIDYTQTFNYPPPNTHVHIDYTQNFNYLPPPNTQVLSGFQLVH